MAKIDPDKVEAAIETLSQLGLSEAHAERLRQANTTGPTQSASRGDGPPSEAKVSAEF